MPKKVELTRHEVLVPKSLKKWIVSTSKKSGTSQAELTVAALNNHRKDYDSREK